MWQLFMLADSDPGCRSDLKIFMVLMVNKQSRNLHWRQPGSLCLRILLLLIAISVFPAQAADEIGHIMRFTIHQLEGLDPLLDEIDRRHAQYLRTSLRQVRYQLVNAEGSAAVAPSVDHEALAAELWPDLRRYEPARKSVPAELALERCSSCHEPTAQLSARPPRLCAPCWHAADDPGDPGAEAGDVIAGEYLPDLY